MMKKVKKEKVKWIEMRNWSFKRAKSEQEENCKNAKSIRRVSLDLLSIPSFKKILC